MKTEKYNVTGMTCAACSAHVEKAVRGVAGVDAVSVNLLMNQMAVSYEEPATADAICRAVEKAGYGAALAGRMPGKARAGRAASPALAGRMPLRTTRRRSCAAD